MGCTSEQGSECESDEKPTRQVTVSDFYLGKYEVTQKQWREVMGSNPPDLEFPGCDQCPVERVSWNDVQGFLKKLNTANPGKNYRLPTEAEWEYAARGGSLSGGYKYAGSNNLDEVAWTVSNSGRKTRPVGGKKANELGLHDMSGNVWEWCSDWWGNYPATAQTNPTGPSTGGNPAALRRGGNRVLRGGSWINDAQRCRLAERNYDVSMERYPNLGFRLARSL
ncbi:MAG: formylglycine-generating enzyme family protein [Lewinellaceae bacterium]|nr:formylglycine-generating enzyme family protein [Lewinellaceae bacterium]